MRKLLQLHLAKMLFIAAMVTAVNSWGQTIVSDGLNNTAGILSVSGGTYYSGNSGTTGNALPASSPFFSEGTHGYGRSNGAAVLTTTNNVNTSGYTAVQLSFKLASFSVNSAGNGADSGDIVKVEVSPDGGTTYYNTLEVEGNNNACWAYTATGVATTAYDGNATPVNFSVSGGTGLKADGYSTVTVTGLPSTTTLKVRITLTNNAANERWMMDDFKITGTAVPTGPSTTLTTTGFNGAFGNIYVGASSSSSSFTVSGSLLTANVNIAAPTDFQVSADNSAWGSSFSIPFGSGTITNIPVYVRFTPGTTGAKSGNVTVNSTGATERTVAVSGTGLAPTITTTATGFGPFCANTSNNITVPYTSAGTFSGGAFSVQRSAAGGTFADATSNMLATVSSTASSVTATLPSGLTAGNYKVRIVYTSATPVVSSNDNGSNIVLTASVAQAATTGTATPVGAVTATLNGSVTAAVCPANSIEKGFVYSAINTNPQVGGADVTKTQVGNATITTGTYTLGLTSLTPGTQYSYASYVYDGTNYAYGAVNTFTTSNPTAALSGTLNEASLNGATFTITLAGELFVETPTFTGTGFTLGNAPAGVSITSVARVDDTHATVTLAYDNTDFDANASINITIPSSHITANEPLVSGNLTITAVIESIASAGTLAFNGQCINTTPTSSFTLTGTTKAVAINLAATTYFKYSLTSEGPYTPTLSFTAPAGALSRVIYVQFAPAAVQAYSEAIAISGGGATGFNKTVTGSGTNTAPTVANPTSGTVTATTAILGGNITSIGCSNATVRGVEYSTTNNFTNGSGIQVTESGSFATGTFTMNVGSLTPATQYYYKAFATNNSGSPVYSAQGTFTTPCATPVNVTSLLVTLPASAQLQLNWTNGSCSDEVLVVAKLGSAVTATPSGDGTAYTANAAFGSGTAIATGEYVVYKGSAATATVTGLTNGSTYHFTVFTRKGTNWSSGVTTTGVPLLTYCSASANSAGEEYISGIVFNSVSHTSGDTGLGYENFTNIVFEADQGHSYVFSATSDGGYATDQLLVWVDWNQDGDFADAGESITLGTSTGLGPFSGNITVPANALTGNTRMRIRLHDTDTDYTPNNTPCGASGFGQVEDYTINVKLPLPAPVITAETNITTNSFEANWNSVDGATSYRLDVSTLENFGTVVQAISGTANFSSMQPSMGSASYTTITSTDTQGIVWTSNSARTDQTITGAAVCLNQLSSAYLQSDEIPNGLASLTFKYQQKFTGTNGKLTVKALTGAGFTTEVLLGILDITTSSQTFSSGALSNISGPFKIRIETNGSVRVAIDDIAYTTTAGLITSYVSGYENLTVNGTSHLVSGLTQNTTYYYRVRAVNATQTSANDTDNVKTVLENIWTSTGWSAGVAPTAIDKATINYDYNTGTDGEITAMELEVLNGTLTIEEGDNLTITKQITISNSTHVVAAGEQATYGAPVGETVIVGPKIVVENNAGLIQVDDTNNTGFIKVDRKSAPIFRLDYALWSSPVAGETLIGFSPKTLTNRFYKYNPLSDAYNNSMTSQGTIAFAEGESYLIRVANTHPAYVDETSTPERWEGSYVGTPFNGDVNVSVTPRNVGVTSGFNAVGNPYPSPIKVAEFFSRNSGNLVNGSPIFLWRKKNDAGTSSYVQLTMAGLNVPNDNPNGNSSDGEYDVFAQNGQWVLNTGQGFIVQAQSGSIVFDNEMRFAKNHDFQFRTAQDETVTASRLWLNLKNTLGESSPAMIAYTANTTLGLDYGWDGRAMTDGPVTLYSVVGDSKLGIQARPSFENTDEVPMSYEAEAAGTYTLSLDQFDGVFAQGQDIFVRDNVLGVTHDLKGGAYEFASEAGTINGRFDVIYAQALNTGNPIWSEASVMVYKDGSNINISTGVTDMTSVKIYDTRGRMLYSGDNINATETVISGLQAEKQVLIVTIATLKGEVSKKIIF